MTHDELLTALSYDRPDFGNEYAKALRAVVELHKPWANGQMYCQVCVGESYPCRTIQAIERELK